MGTTPFKLQPQTGYLVAASPDYAGIVQEWLVDYYQPLLSPTALSLLLALSGRLVPNPMPAERHQHTVLLDQLGVGINQIDQARGRLEALAVADLLSGRSAGPGSDLPATGLKEPRGIH